MKQTSLQAGRRLAEGPTWCQVHSEPGGAGLSSHKPAGGWAVVSARAPEQEVVRGYSGDEAVAGCPDGAVPRAAEGW